MSTAPKIDPATDAKLGDLEEKLAIAHTIHAHAINADDALTVIERVIGGTPGMGDIAHYALFAVHEIAARARDADGGGL